jgi:hypothetical protein
VFFIPLERSWSVNVQNGLAWAIWTSTLQVMVKRKVRNRFNPGVQVKCDTPLESSRGELQVCFKPHPNRRSELGVMSSQSPGSSNRDIFGTPLWESWDKKPFVCRCGQTQRILYGGRWWLPLSLGHGESSEFGCPWLVPTLRVIPNVD